MNFLQLQDVLKQDIANVIQNLYQIPAQSEDIILQPTRKEFTGDITLVVFPYLKASKKTPEHTAEDIGKKLLESSVHVESYNVIKGFLNLVFNSRSLINCFSYLTTDSNFGFLKDTNPKTILVEYSSPNTNKPLHLGHIRNNLLGFSVAELLKAAGHNVIKVNLVNDRGIHICKSMLAWVKYGKGETPESANMKGDHLVGKYYVLFDKQYKAEVEQLIKLGNPKDQAEKLAPIMQEAHEMLRKWEANDKETVRLWEMMNNWVYQGFDQTYKMLGVDFDKIYYESQTYLLGKKIVEEGLKKGIFNKKADQSVWVDLTASGLDEKLLLRSDGTSVYITQDLGTAVMRQSEFKFNNLVYVVGNEQDYHFKVLKLVMKQLGYPWAEGLYHLSYGMVELPEGKMKSREGTVVDADDLISGMLDAARKSSEELGKLDELDGKEAEKLYKVIALGALKYFILKVDPKKKILFNPQESIDLNGNTGPFIQYTYARIQSILRKSPVRPEAIQIREIPLTSKERNLIKSIGLFPSEVKNAALLYSPALIANYIYELAKEYNQFYHEYPILKEDRESICHFRIRLSAEVGKVINKGMRLLGIEVPERM